MARENGKGKDGREKKGKRKIEKGRKDRRGGEKYERC